MRPSLVDSWATSEYVFYACYLRLLVVPTEIYAYAFFGHVIFAVCFAAFGARFVVPAEPCRF